MRRNRKTIISIYCIFVIFVCSYLILKMDTLSKFWLKNMRNECIPLAAGENYGIKKLFDELLPCLTLIGDIPGDELFFMEGEYSEYTWDLAAEYDNKTGEKMENDENNLELDNNGNEEENENASTNTKENENSEINSDENKSNCLYIASVVDGPSAYTDENQIVETLGNVSYQNGIFYSMEDLNNFDFLIKNCYNVDNSTNVKPEELDATTLLNMDMSVDLLSEDYKILIYHTHGSEAFVDSRAGFMEDTVIGVGDELTRILEEEYGIKVYHDKTIYDCVDGVLDRSKAYDLSGNKVDQILAEYPSIEVVIDLHRDGVREDLHLVRNVNGKDTAQIMFVNGVSRLNLHGDISYLENPNKISNLAFSLKMHLAGKQMFGDLMRNVYISGYRYNLNKCPRACLIEIGAQTNTVEEAKNAMEPLAAIIYRVLKEG